MVPFLEICPKLAFDECRMLIVPPGHQSSGLPPDRYDLEESYCVEPDCDCRRVMLNVTSVSRRHVEAVINFEFDAADPLRGPFLDPLNPQGQHAEALLELVRQQVQADPQYVQRLERHYQVVRDIVAGRLRPEEAAPAPTLLGPTVVGAGRAKYDDPDNNVAENVAPFDIHKQVIDEYGESDEGEVAEYIDGLMGQFADSPEAQPIFDAGRRLGWATTLMNYGFDHLGVAPPSMDLEDFREVAFQIIPRKVSVDADRAEEIVTELRAFWKFLQRCYGLKNAAEILRDLDSNAVERLHDKLDDPANFSMVKSILGLGLQAGFDMTTQDGLTKFMLAYNSGLLGGRRPNPPPAPRRELSMFGDNAIAEEFGNRADRRAAKRAQRREVKKSQRGRR